ncbi:Ig-like domain repeat protein [Nocardioides sp. LHD-245]|uniref:Ig-like domain repeat protein n=1 Tax=Nocardioides sp. LHD-245 TaxID=3051387 RepID=UPI0027DF7268|nr:Ig-like domain repeat protein [Nocardioides sp. LHD-245]
MRTRHFATLGLLLAFAATSVLSAPPATADPQPFGPSPWLVRDTVSGTGSSTVNRGVVLGGLFVYAQHTPGYGIEPWVSDGTTAGTRLLVDIVPGATSSNANNLVRVGSWVFFTAQLPATGTELWVTDGTATGTRLVEDLEPGPDGSGIFKPVAAGDRLFFNADTTGSGRELWISDGTEAGTQVVEEINPAGAHANPLNVTAVGSRVAFTALSAVGGREPWISDGTPAGTHRIGDINPSGDSAAGDFVALGDAVLFRAASAGDNPELYRWPGTGLVSSQVKDIYPGGAVGGEPRDLAVHGGRVYFSARHPDTGTELWTTDGTEAGTHLIQDLLPGPGNGQPHDLVWVGGRLYFEAADSATTSGLFTTSGTAAGTRLVKRLTVGGAEAFASNLRAAGDRVLFKVFVPDPVSESLWISDGTPAGTTSLLTITHPDAMVWTADTGTGTAFVNVRHPSTGEEVWAYTWRTSTTLVTAKKKWSAKKARKRRIKLTVQVAATGATPDGTVTIWAQRKGKSLKKKQKRIRLVGVGTVVDGAARVRIGKRLKPGRYRITARYAGSPEAASSTSAQVRIKVKR